MKLSLRTLRRTLAVACVCMLVVLPAASALALPAELSQGQTPDTTPASSSQPITVQVEHTNNSARTLSIVLASTALLIAIGGAGYAFRVGHQRHALGS